MVKKEPTNLANTPRKSRTGMDKLLAEVFNHPDQELEEAAKLMREINANFKPRSRRLGSTKSNESTETVAEKNDHSSSTECSSHHAQSVRRNIQRTVTRNVVRGKVPRYVKRSKIVDES
jgi:hypothetical protein